MSSFKLINQANLNFCKLQKPMLDWVERKALSLHFLFECEPFHSFSMGYTRNVLLLRLERPLDYPHIYIDRYNHIGMTASYIVPLLFHVVWFHRKQVAIVNYDG
jgi:hypothetical protein